MAAKKSRATRRLLLGNVAILFVGIIAAVSLLVFVASPFQPWEKEAIPAHDSIAARQQTAAPMAGGIPPVALSETVPSHEIPAPDAFDSVCQRLSIDAMRALRGEANLANGHFRCDIINSPQQELSTMVVRVTAWKADGNRESRTLRLTASGRAGGATVFEGTVDLDLQPWQRWDWSIVEARYFQ